MQEYRELRHPRPNPHHGAGYWYRLVCMNAKNVLKRPKLATVMSVFTPLRLPLNYNIDQHSIFRMAIDLVFIMYPHVGRHACGLQHPSDPQLCPLHHSSSQFDFHGKHVTCVHIHLLQLLITSVFLDTTKIIPCPGTSIHSPKFIVVLSFLLVYFDPRSSR